MAIPDGLESGQTVSLTVPGKLTVRGVTRDVTATLEVQPSGAQIGVAGKIVTDMTEFGITPPHLPITVVQPLVTVDFLVNFVRGA